MHTLLLVEKYNNYTGYLDFWLFDLVMADNAAFKVDRGVWDKLPEQMDLKFG